MPAGGYGLTLLLHSLGANYNQFLDSKNQSQFGERGPGSIVITAEGRGPDGWYYDYAGADIFEMWADVAARYQLDPEWTAIAGYSMGGYAHLQVRDPVPRPVRQGSADGGPARPGDLGAAGRPAAGRSAVEHEPHARRRCATSRS